MKRIDWDRFSPLGIAGKTVWKGLCFALGCGIGAALIVFWSRFSNAYGELFEYTEDRIPVLRSGTQMLPFAVLMDGALTLLWIVMGCMPVVALALYLVHYQDGRSIYTMRRLPRRWELWRRCITLPVWMAVLCAAAAGLVTLLCYGAYLWITPTGCLPH